MTNRLVAAERNGTSPDAELPSFVRLADVDAEAKVEWDAQGLILCGEFGLWTGKGGGYKTSTLLAMQAGLATARRVFGKFFVPRMLPCCFVSGEDPAGIIRNRLEAICRGHGYPVTEALENVHVLALSGIDLADTTWCHHVRDEVMAIGAGMLVFDPLAEVDSRAENDNDERRQLVKVLRWLQSETGTTVLVAHHFRKSTEGADKSDLIRGGNALTNASRQTYALERSDDGTVTVENVKFSRAAKRPPFVLRPIIETDPHNEARWLSARFEYATVTEVKLDNAETFVLRQLDTGDRMTTTELKKAATGTGVAGADISRALKVLEMRQMIDFEPGEHNAKRWGVCLPGNHRQPEKGVAGQPDCLPGNTNRAGSACQPPYRGASRNPSLGIAGQPEGAA